MPYSRVPPCVQVRPGLSSCFHSRAYPTGGKQTPLFPFGGAYGKTYLCPPSRLPEPTGRWPQPAVRTRTACHQGPLPLLWLCNFAYGVALRRLFVVVGNRNRNTRSLNLACGSWLGRVHKRPLYQRCGAVRKMAKRCLRHGLRLVSIVRTCRSPPGLWLMAWPSTQTPAVPAVWCRE